MSDIIKIEGQRFRIGPTGTCWHYNVKIDTADKTIWCDDCGAFLEAFEVLRNALNRFARERARLKREREEVHKLRKANRHLLAARKVESAWKSRTTVPACPHCNKAILPEDGFGDSLVSRELELQRRQK